MRKSITGKAIVGLLVPLGFGGLLLVDAAEADAATLYRAYNPNTGEHLYTANGNEIPFVVSAGWKDEGSAWEVPSKGAPVYRVFNPNNGGDHHYTLNYNEVTNLTSQGWRAEGVAWQSAGSIPVHRLYNPNAKTGTHHFTIDANEKDSLVKVGWKYEGVAMYSGSDQAVTPQPAQPKPITVATGQIGNCISAYPNDPEVKANGGLWTTWASANDWGVSKIEAAGSNYYRYDVVELKMSDNTKRWSVNLYQ